MDKILTKKSIIKKTIQVGITTFFSRILGLTRVMFQGRYLGYGAMADAFTTAWKFPNSLRKIFAEGALSAAFVPIIVGIIKKKEIKEANSFMTLSFLMIEGFLILLCLTLFIFADFFIGITTPGFSTEQVRYVVPAFKILISFIIFVSSSALLAGALQASHHFFVPAFAPILINIVFISAFILGIYYHLPLEYVCYMILFGGLLSFALHLFTYFKLNFSFGSIDKQAFVNFKTLMVTFLPIVFAMSVVEINLFLDVSLASYLKTGSIAIIEYASRFMQIPLGVFSTAFATILLPHFSRISLYAPKRLSFYLLESAKLIFWVTIPATILLGFFSKEIFMTIFKFPENVSIEAGNVLIAFLTGLFFFSLHKILLNIYYSLRTTSAPTIVSIIGTVISYGLNLLLMQYFAAAGLALATSISFAVQVLMLAFFLHKKYQFKFYPTHFIRFLIRFLIQLAVVLPLFFGLYYLIINQFSKLSPWWSNLLLNSIFLWAWVGPLCLLVYLFLFFFKKYFGVKMYFLDK